MIYTIVLARASRATLRVVCYACAKVYFTLTMQTALADFIKNSPDGPIADKILRACVHCGFCTATCPTYQLIGDELDGPRGRIYQIKQ